MPKPQTRRRYLLTVGAAGAVGLAGCSDGGTETETGGTDTGTPPRTATETPTDDEPTDGSATIPGWAEWLPSAQVTDGDATVLMIDIPRARSEYPADAYAQFGISELSDSLSVQAENIDYFGGTQTPSGQGVTLLLGQFDTEAVGSALGGSESRTGSYQNYAVYDDSIAVGEAAIITSGYQSALDTRFGSTPAVGTDDPDWAMLLSLLDEGTFMAAESGYFGDEDLPVEVLQSGVTIDATETGGSLLTGHLLFETEDDAATALSEYEDAIVDDQADDSSSVRSVEQEGRRVVLTVESETFSF